MFDEPVNGLDPEGIRWIRGFSPALAAEGRTVLVSSHLMSEMALTADHLIIIGRGRLLADTPTAELIDVQRPRRRAAALAAGGRTRRAAHRARRARSPGRTTARWP